MDLPVQVNMHLEPGGQGVDNRNAYPVKPSGNLVAALVELAAGVQLGHNNFKGAYILPGMKIYRDTAAVVGYANNVSLFDTNVDLAAVTGKSFVYTVIDNLIDQMVKSVGACCPYVHTGTFPDGFQALENLDIFR
jgi:hypothetical protein